MPKPPYEPLNIEANHEVVIALTKHLTLAFEEFVRRHPDHTIQFVDSFMAAHNFHKTIVLDLEERLNDTDHFVRKAAIDTFEEALLRDVDHE